MVVSPAGMSKVDRMSQKVETMLTVDIEQRFLKGFKAIFCNKTKLLNFAKFQGF